MNFAFFVEEARLRFAGGFSSIPRLSAGHVLGDVAR